MTTWKWQGQAAQALICAGIAAVMVFPAHALVKKKPVAHHPATSKGQSQLSGGNGEFGVVYTMKDLYNFEVVSAKYTIDPWFGEYNQIPGPGQKLLVVSVAIKNASPNNMYYSPSNTFTVYDQHGKIYNMGDACLSSDPKSGGGHALNPGQGVGQPALNDPYTLAFVLDGDSKAEKLIMNEPRAGSNETVFRYYFSTATEAEDGANGDPKNVLAKLPKGVADPSDPSGATALKQGDGGKPGDGTVMPSGQWYITVPTVTVLPASATFNGNAAGAGNEFVEADLTAKNGDVNPMDSYYVEDYSSSAPILIDTDGDTFPLLVNTDALKMSSDENVSGSVGGGETRKYRLLFDIPQNTKLQTLRFAGGGGFEWDVDISGIFQ